MPYWCKGCGKQVGPDTLVCPNCHARFMGTQDGTLEQFREDQKRYRKAERHRKYGFIYNFIDDHFPTVLIVIMITLFVAIFSLGTLSIYLGFNTLGTILRVIGVVVIALPSLIGIVLGGHIIKEKYEEEIHKKQREVNEVEKIRKELKEVFDTQTLNRILEERNQTEEEFIKEQLYNYKYCNRWEMEEEKENRFGNRWSPSPIPSYNNPYVYMTHNYYHNVYMTHNYYHKYDEYQPRWCPDIIWTIFVWILTYRGY